jgi:hypothetical protein
MKISKREIERMIIIQLNKTEHLSKKDFDALAESIIDYIDEISRSKNQNKDE